MQLNDPGMTLKEFQGKVSEEMDLKGDLAVFYVESGFNRKINNDEQFQKALTVTTSFAVEVLKVPYLIRVTYETIVYAFEIKSLSLEEFNNELCKQFAWNKRDLESIQLVHGSTIIVGSLSLYFEKVIQTSNDTNALDFIIQPRVLPSKPTVINESSVSMSTAPTSAPPPATVSAPVKVTVLPHDSLVKESFDVMLSYEWKSGTDIVLKIKQEL
ncbi:hypothetical protein HDU76_006618 [Blyttiomyces sp. JEL0837]|nr:hypothetical protein HDU76_006618 [Blyttiomyces sp. JEL0837]